MPAYSKQSALVRLEVEIAKGEFQTWYSFANDDKQSIVKSVISLKQRILAKKLNGIFLNAVIYNNQTGEIIEGQTNKFDKNISQFRLVVFWLTGEKSVFYSKIGAANFNDVIYDFLPDTYQTAFVETNRNAGYSGTILTKYIRGQKIF